MNLGKTNFRMKLEQSLRALLLADTLGGDEAYIKAQCLDGSH